MKTPLIKQYIRALYGEQSEDEKECVQYNFVTKEHKIYLQKSKKKTLTNIDLKMRKTGITECEFYE